MKRLMLAAMLALGGCATAVDDLFDNYTAYLTGGSIAPGLDGHLYGSGMAEFWMGNIPLRFCYLLNVDKIDGPYVAHLHRGRAHVIGPEILTLKPQNGVARGCVDMTRRLRAEIAAEPQAFYVDVHTSEFPLGALRGQLERQSPDLRRD